MNSICCSKKLTVSIEGKIMKITCARKINASAQFHSGLPLFCSHAEHCLSPPDIYWQRVFFFKNKNRFRFHCERFFHSHSLRVVIVCVCVCIMFYFHSTHLTMSILLFSLARLFVFGAYCERMNAAKHLRWPNYSKFLRA